jgi:hypothetical protein
MIIVHTNIHQFSVPNWQNPSLFPPVIYSIIPLILQTSLPYTLQHLLFYPLFNRFPPCPKNSTSRRRQRCGRPTTSRRRLSRRRRRTTHSLSTSTNPWLRILSGLTILIPPLSDLDLAILIACSKYMLMAFGT